MDLISIDALPYYLWAKGSNASWRTLALTGQITPFQVGRKTYVNRNELDKAIGAGAPTLRMAA